MPRQPHQVDAMSSIKLVPKSVKQFKSSCAAITSKETMHQVDVNHAIGELTNAFSKTKTRKCIRPLSNSISINLMHGILGSLAAQLDFVSCFCFWNWVRPLSMESTYNWCHGINWIGVSSLASTWCGCRGINFDFLWPLCFATNSIFMASLDYPSSRSSQ